MRPFLFLGTRAEDDVAHQEYDAVLAGCGLRPEELVRVRLEAGPLGAVDLDDWSGIILGGGPYNMSDPEDAKSPAQRRAEADLRALAARVVSADVPFLGACYGLGVLGILPGGGVDRHLPGPRLPPGPQRLRHAVPPRARPGRDLRPHRRLQRPRLLRAARAGAPPGRRPRGEGDRAGAAAGEVRGAVRALT